MEPEFFPRNFRPFHLVHSSWNLHTMYRTTDFSKYVKKWKTTKMEIQGFVSDWHVHYVVSPFLFIVVFTGTEDTTFFPFSLDTRLSCSAVRGHRLILLFMIFMIYIPHIFNSDEPRPVFACWDWVFGGSSFYTQSWFPRLLQTCLLWNVSKWHNLKIL